MRALVGDWSTVIHGEAVKLGGVPVRQCEACGERRIVARDAMRHEQRAFDVYRARHELMTPSQLRALRRRRALAREDLARMLDVTVEQIDRWEGGRYVHSAAIDTVLCMVRDLPGALAYLRERTD